MKNKLSLLLPVLALLALAGVQSVRAGTHTWNGGGSTEYWNNPANWTGGAPLIGEAAPIVLIFPSAGFTTNNISGLVVDSLQFHGVGNSVHGAGGGSLTIRGGNSSTNLWFKGNTALEADLPVGFTGTNVCAVNPSQAVNIYTSLTGTGEVFWVGGGKAEYLGTAANTFSGITRIRDASLTLNKPAGVNAIAGPVIMEEFVNSSFTLTLANDNQIADTVPVTIGEGQILFGQSKNEKFGNVTFNGGYINLVNGLLTLNGNVTVQTNDGLIINPISLGGVTRTFQVASNSLLRFDDVISDGGAAAGLNLTGGGQFILKGTNTFTGIVQVTNSTVQIENDLALGSSAAGTLIDSNSTLVMYKQTVAAEPLTLAGTLQAYLGFTNAWNGSVTLQGNVKCLVDLSGFCTIGGVISGSGALVKTGPGTLTFAGSAANSYSGGTEVQKGRLFLSKTNANAIPGTLKFTGLEYDKEVRLIFPNQIANTATVTLTNGSLLNLTNNSEGIGSLVGSSTSLVSPAVVGLGTGTLTNSPNGITTFGGIITGTGTTALVKNGLGTLTLTGSNTCSGACLLNQGTLTVNGTLPGPITQGLNTFLAGTGTVGQVTCNSGYLQPAGSDQGTLKTGNLIFNSSSAVAFMELGFTTNDVLNVTGAVTLNNCSLAFDSYTAGKIGKKFTLIANDGADAINGTFNGLSEGANINYGSLNYTISYVGGTGNDVVLTQTTQPAGAQIQTITKQLNGQMVITGLGENGAVFDMQASTNLATTNWVSLGVVYADGFGTASFTDTNAASFKQRFYRLVQQ